ncbi:SIS domain-containing protein [Cellulomonas pakistanensis]|uniref:Tagatose-6-phosphate ketose/aldose isomerase n=1 Tax=Cellulomonas pakistanensis TaxID=992287 RepID=A0A919PAT0_9CELL|nr:SIS domain-containing protein [Cellulomonas pakistanensis]GIG36243.1 putative tagatose-6-phosphate ketose/aldose isomerase [Cellulomonas pakistanensis]
MTAPFTELFAPLDVEGSAHTAREIAQQPAVWRKVADVISSARAEIDAKIAPLLAREDLRIVFTGAGTSAYVGDTIAPALGELRGLVADAVPTTDIVSNPRAAFVGDRPTLLVSFARSGNSPESVAATELADRFLTEVHHLIITCNAEGGLAVAHADRERSTVLLLPPETNDQSFAMTSSFSSMLLSGWLITSGADDAEVRATCAQVAAAGEALLAERVGEIEKLAFNAPGRIVYLGSGPLAGAANEAGLKILELTAGKVVPWSDSSLGFRHGPKAVLDPTTLAVVLVSGDPYTRRYDLDIARELAAAVPDGRLLVLSADPVELAGVVSWSFPELAGAGDVATALVAVLVAQIVALFSSVGVGCTPDNPFPGGSVNRVVQGVVIHPLEG